ncbi:uncharacterized protein Z519_00804 [Cladophialophora bantiana CBS 173.52]|uniref:Threonine/serine exporter-like N-terminal domain-containing protein n=1 Tax=Cladophialophora bantiana (strain ATCC 10958 / CBS 173.52 / CDC B-1940 / NIH 8579) TaxID=1442370 RepID=A0A0D2FAJ8_CLAB1|nr:uncharacterized protein Z519_00804 [Cladophialophora bantiana CBS 173.52]KIW99141.1 hypothetical protein Z519_00804 [Cladophialophora bantiana CBS 173.52]
MAERDIPLPTSEKTSNDSDTNPIRRHSIRGFRHGNRHHQKVKFSDIADDAGESIVEASTLGDVPKMRLSDSEDVADHGLPASDWAGITHAAAAQAQDRASRLANRLNHSRAQSKQHQGILISQSSTPQASASPSSSPPTKPLIDWLVNDDDIALEPLEKDKRPYTLHDETSDDDTDSDPKALHRDNENVEEARRLIRTLTSAQNATTWQEEPRSGAETPAVDKRLHDLDYVPPPNQYRPSVFGALLASKLAHLQRNGITQPTYHEDLTSHTPNKYSPKGFYSKGHSRAGSESRDHSTPSSGRATPSKRPKWYDKDSHERQSTGSLATLLAQASVTSAAAAAPQTSNYVPRPPLHHAKSSNGMIATAVDMIKHPGNYFHHKSTQSLLIDEERVILDVAEIIACRKYLKKLARCLMAVGAPTHRLEEYMKTSARALNIDGDFLYMPGSMLVSINDRVTMSTEVTLVKESQNVDLGKFRDVFDVYKLVIHGKYTAEQGTADLGEIMKKRGRHSLPLRIFAYGIAAIAVGPFAFAARPVDFGPSFILGCILGWLQLVVVTRSEQFSHVFEILASVLISFASRGLGSIYHKGTAVFCFSAIAQSSIALILPGYMVLCSALELQSKSIVSGSVRMVYAIIYSLFLGFGILIGTVVMGLIYPQAQSDVTCNTPIWWNDSNHGPKLLYVRFIWVPIFAICLATINQAKWKQIPVMTLIAFVGYQANFWISTKLSNNIQVANAIGAFAIGTMANLYSRFFHGLAAAAMLPAIFVQVPSGLAASGSLVAGITSADQITGNVTGVSVINNGTAGFLDAQNSTSSASVYGGTIFNVGGEAERHAKPSHRPTFDPARGKEAQRGPAYHQRLLPAHTLLKVRQPGQGGAAEAERRDLRAELLAAEAAHFAKTKGATAEPTSSTPKPLKRELEDSSHAGDGENEDPDTKRRRILEETREIDADSDGSDTESSEEESDEEDETAELMRELEKIKKERAEQKAREEAEQAQQAQDQRERDIALGNPLLNPKAFNVKRRWDDDVVFKNQARGTEQKGNKEFVNVRPLQTVETYGCRQADENTGLAQVGFSQEVYGMNDSTWDISELTNLFYFSRNMSDELSPPFTALEMVLATKVDGSQRAMSLKSSSEMRLEGSPAS